MCPVCAAAMALLAVKATSGSALAALAFRKIHGKPAEHDIPSQPQTKEDQHVQHHDSN